MSVTWNKESALSLNEVLKFKIPITSSMPPPKNNNIRLINNWTLEISCVHPVRIYAGMPIGQLIYFAVHGDILNYYNKKEGAKYNTKSVEPVESMMWKNTF